LLFLPKLLSVEVIAPIDIDVSMASGPDVLQLFVPRKLPLLLQLLNYLLDVNRVPNNHCVRDQIQTANLIGELFNLLLSNFWQD
jgi:hypothetical protein